MSFRDVCRIDGAAAEESCRLRFFAGNLGGSAKILKLLGIRPGHLRGDAIDLPEGPVDAESVIFVESSEAVSRFQGGVKRARIMIALVNPGLIGVGRAREGLIVVFEDKNGLSVTSATLRRVEPVKPCAKDDFVVMMQGRPIEAGGAYGEICSENCNAASRNAHGEGHKTYWGICISHIK